MHLFYLKIPLSHLQTSVFCISLVEGLGFPYRERDEKVNIEMVDLLFAWDSHRKGQKGYRS